MKFKPSNQTYITFHFSYFVSKLMDKYDEIAKLCIDKYKELLFDKKLKNNEWTILSGLVCEFNSKYTLLSLCTGTKCLNHKAVCNGFVISDCHAEILVRRGLMKYCYDYLLKTSQHIPIEPNIFERVKEKYQLKKDVKLHYYISQSPCGDCSIFEDENEELEPPRKRSKVEYDKMHRTGARLIMNNDNNNNKSDKIDINNLYVTGKLRLKPGRGKKNDCVSCSDKICLWNEIGIEGNVLNKYFESIRIDSFIIGDNFNEKAMKRGIYERISMSDLSISNKPIIIHTNLVFNRSEKEVIKNNGKDKIDEIKSSNLSIIYIIGNKVEIINGKTGIKEGGNKKDLKNNKSSLCRYSFLQILQMYNEIMTKSDKKLNYLRLKKENREYEERKNEILKVLDGWPRKKREEYDFECI